MMRIGIFLIGFVAAMIPAVNYLARKDPEPDMAGLSLILFGFFALIASIGAFSSSAARLRVSPGKVMALCTGAACAIGFYVALSLIHTGLGLLPVLGLSFALALSTAWASPLLSRASV